MALFVFDYETTGLDFRTARPVEVAVIDENYVKHIHTKCNPLCEIEEEALKVHGIAIEDLEEAPFYYTVIGQQLDLFDQHENCITAGYNISAYDALIFEQITQAPFHYRMIDVLDIIYRYFPTKKSKKLSDIYKEAFGKELEGAHGALADCEATLDLLNALSEHFNKSYEGWAKELSTPQVYERIPIGKYRGRFPEDTPISWVNWIEQNFEYIRPDLKATIEYIKEVNNVDSSEN